MALLTDPVVKADATVQRNFDALASSIFRGVGSPLNVVKARRGSLYLRQDGGAGTTLYVKETEVTVGDSTGWVAK